MTYFKTPGIIKTITKAIVKVHSIFLEDYTSPCESVGKAVATSFSHTLKSLKPRTPAEYVFMGSLLPVVYSEWLR